MQQRGDKDVSGEYKIPSHFLLSASPMHIRKGTFEAYEVRESSLSLMCTDKCILYRSREYTVLEGNCEVVSGGLASYSKKTDPNSFDFNKKPNVSTDFFLSKIPSFNVLDIIQHALHFKMVSLERYSRIECLANFRCLKKHNVCIYIIYLLKTY